ncbi:unnamed protein product [Symbiodinium natans]|uniref:Uncharacterized protein n=1 Tax=Symbiodinium natans TaxID=878477 RepID=A0A812R0V0_9DINO|nr:unnamed protein product [Symbiodinium natans]
MALALLALMAHVAASDLVETVQGTELGCCMAAMATSLTGCSGPCEWYGGSICSCRGEGIACQVDATGFCGVGGSTPHWSIPAEFLGVDATACFIILFAGSFAVVMACLLICFCCSGCPGYSFQFAEKPQDPCSEEVP